MVTKIHPVRQTLRSLKVSGYVQNEGEARSRKVVLHLDLSDPKKLKLLRSLVNSVLEHSLPELHPGQGQTKVMVK